MLENAREIANNACVEGWASCIVTVSVFLIMLPSNANTAQSIDSIIKLLDGQRVTLSAVWVDKVSVKPSYIVVREPWSADERIVVLSDKPLSLQRWQTVDVEGVLTTLRNGYRAIVATKRHLYPDHC